MQPPLAYDQYGYPSRRRQYNNQGLNSSVELLWLHSLEHAETVKDGVLERKKKQGHEKIVLNYNAYVNRKLSQRYPGVQSLNTISYQVNKQPQNIYPITKPKSGSTSFSKQFEPLPQNEQQKLSKSKVTLDQSLNFQIENFNKRSPQRQNSTNSTQQNSQGSRRSASDRHSSLQKQPKYNVYYNMNPSFMKQMILRSAMDQPVNYERQMDFQPNFKSLNKDKLQDYLRGNRSKRY